MARNVQTDTEKILQGEKLEPEKSPIDIDFLNPKRIVADDKQEETSKFPVTMLHKLLNEVPMETLLRTIQTMQVSITLRSEGNGKWCGSIKGVGTFHYHTQRVNSPNMALVNLLVSFFRHETKDYHEYEDSAWG